MYKNNYLSITQLIAQGVNPIQEMISLAWLNRTELKTFLKISGLPVSHNYDLNLSTARLALRGAYVLSGNDIVTKRLSDGWKWEDETTNFQHHAKVEAWKDVAKALKEFKARNK